MDAQIFSDTLPVRVPIPLHQMIEVGAMTGRDGTRFGLVMGLDERLTGELKIKSLNLSDNELQENTSDHKRFGEGSYERWYEQKRVPFALIDTETGALAALAWYGPKPVGIKSMKHLTDEEQERVRAMEAGEWHTIVYRAYAPYRGTGLMRAFVSATMAIYGRYFPHARYWTSVNHANAASIALSERLGFTIDESRSDAQTVTMIK